MTLKTLKLYVGRLFRNLFLPLSFLVGSRTGNAFHLAFVLYICSFVFSYICSFVFLTYVFVFLYMCVCVFNICFCVFNICSFVFNICFCVFIHLFFCFLHVCLCLFTFVFVFSYICFCVLELRSISDRSLRLRSKKMIRFKHKWQYLNISFGIGAEQYR